MDLASIPSAITADLTRRGITRIDPMPPGMSGASVFRCFAANGDAIALKRWPAATTSARVDEVHRVVLHATERGCEFVPQFHWWTERGTNCLRWTEKDRHWEAAQWLPGTPLPMDATLSQIRAGAMAIATFHNSVSDLGQRLQTAPAVIARVNRLEELDTIARRWKPAHNLPPSLHAEVENARQLLDWKWKTVRSELGDRLRRYLDHAVPIQYGLRDVHREHVLFEDGQPAGLIDFDAVRFDTPLTDLARWAGSFLAGRGELQRDAVWDAATAGFRDQWPSSYSETLEAEPMMAKDLCRCSQWISLANWLDWILNQRRHFAAGPDKIAARIRDLIRTVQ